MGSKELIAVPPTLTTRHVPQGREVGAALETTLCSATCPQPDPRNLNQTRNTKYF